LATNFSPLSLTKRTPFGLPVLYKIGEVNQYKKMIGKIEYQSKLATQYNNTPNGANKLSDLLV
jgi:hypothetical protein